MPVSIEFIGFVVFTSGVLIALLISQAMVWKSQKADLLAYSKWNEIYIETENQSLKDHKEFNQGEEPSGKFKMSKEGKKLDMKVANALDIARKRNGMDVDHKSTKRKSAGSMYH